MTEADLLRAFEARCTVLAAYATSRGLRLKKSSDKHELEVSGTGSTVAFPVVSDERDWVAMTPEAAFYSLMMDAKSWKNVRLDDATTAGLDESERVEIPLLKREAGAESDRMKALASMLGGDANLDALLANVDSE